MSTVRVVCCVRSWVLRPGTRSLRFLRPLCAQRQCSTQNIIRSQDAPINFPDMTVDEFMWRNLDKWSDRTAVVCGETGRSLTYNEIKRSSDRLAQALRTQMKLQPGDVVAAVMPNVPEYCITLLGCIRAGIIVTTINPIYTSDEIRKQFIDSDAKMVFTLSEMFETVNQARKSLNRNIPISVSTQPQNSIPPGAINFNELCNYDGSTINLGRRRMEDLILLPYSSGTTGLPKGVMLTQKNILVNLMQMQVDGIRLNEITTNNHQDVIPVILPMYHLYALMIVFFNLFSMGCKLVTLPRYHPDKLLSLLEKHKPTLIHAVPPIVHYLCFNDAAKESHLERVRVVMCAAAPLASEDTERFHKKFDHGVKILQGYGLTETSPLTHLQRTNRPATSGGSGWLLPNTDCKIVPLDGPSVALGPRESGQLLIRSPQNMKGYHNNPQATADTIDKDGWLKTGDIGYYDEEGQFFITDRLKELIKVKGFQVAPAELEAVLRDHPDIEDAAVIGIKDEIEDEHPKAFVVRKATSKLSADQVQNYVQAKVAKYKWLTGGVEFIDTVPRNPSGKILRRALKS